MKAKFKVLAIFLNAVLFGSIAFATELDQSKTNSALGILWAGLSKKNPDIKKRIQLMDNSSSLSEFSKKTSEVQIISLIEEKKKHSKFNAGVSDKLITTSVSKEDIIRRMNKEVLKNSALSLKSDWIAYLKLKQEFGSDSEKVKALRSQLVEKCGQNEISNAESL